MKKTNPNKKVTLDSLAKMVKTGFDGADKGFDGINQRITKFQKENKQEHKEIRNKLDSLERRVIFLEDKATEHSEDLKKIKLMIKKLQEQKKADQKQITSIEVRLEKLEAKVA